MGDTAILSNALGSAGAGIISRILTHPLDTAKARLQAVGYSHYKGPVDVLRKTYLSEGVSGLYRGFSTVIVGGTPGTIIYLCSYDIYKDKIGRLSGRGPSDQEGSESFGVHFASGLLAEATACLIYVPVDVVKERLQVQHKGVGSNYKGGYDAFTTIARTEGASGIYKGYAATLMSFGPFSALYFVFYERFKAWSRAYIGSPTLPLHWVVISSASAGALASFLTSPLDMAKLRLQVQRGQGANPSMASGGPVSGGGPTKYRGVVDCLRQAYRHGGVNELFRGAGARVLHFVPATTVTMTLYESMRSFFQDILYKS